MIYETHIDCGMLGELPMAVHFDFHKGSRGDYETPDEPASAEVYKMVVTVNGTDIDFFDELSKNGNFIEDIEWECLEKAEDDALEARYGCE